MQKVGVGYQGAAKNEEEEEAVRKIKWILSWEQKLLFRRKLESNKKLSQI